MKNRDKIEIYHNDMLIACVNSSMVLSVGHYINIAKKTYVINKVTFAIDNALDLIACSMRCNIDVDLEESIK